MDRENQTDENQNSIDTVSIKIGYGIGDLMFGSSMDECLKYLGEPDEEESEMFDGEEYLHWYYDNLGLEICFEASEEYRLGTIVLEDEDAVLDGEHIIGKSIKEIESLLIEGEYGYSIELENVEDEEITLLDVDGMECTFMFRENRLEGVQWSYLWIDDDTPDWPQRNLQ